MTAPRIATHAPVKTTPARASDRSGGSSATGRAPPQARPAGDVPVQAPAATALIIPFDRQPLVAAGERIIFHVSLPDPAPDGFQLEFSSTGGHFLRPRGADAHVVSGLESGNVDFFVPAGWDGRSPLRVILIVRQLSDESVSRSEVWTFGLKTRVPTTMKQREGAEERDLPGRYVYDIGPPLPSAQPPHYQHTTILERFKPRTLANIGPADIQPAYRKAHALNHPAAVTRHFLKMDGVVNGTFTVNQNDAIADKHWGKPDLSRLVSALARPKDIEVALPQTYEAEPGKPLGHYLVTRILKADGATWKVKKQELPVASAAAPGSAGPTPAAKPKPPAEPAR